MSETVSVLRGRGNESVAFELISFLTSGNAAGLVWPSNLSNKSSSITGLPPRPFLLALWQNLHEPFSLTCILDAVLRSQNWIHNKPTQVIVICVICLYNIHLSKAYRNMQYIHIRIVGGTNCEREAKDSWVPWRSFCWLAYFRALNFIHCSSNLSFLFSPQK